MDASIRDVELLQRISAGDRHAMNTLFALYYQRLCSFALAIVQDPVECEEIVADVFVTIWKRAGDLEIRINFRSYIYACVRNACLAHLKGKRSQVNTIEIDADAVAYKSTTNGESDLEFKELESIVSNGIQNLPPRCRQVFMLSRHDGLKYREIADVLDISEKTVENQLVKAVKLIRAYINSQTTEKKS